MAGITTRIRIQAPEEDTCMGRTCLTWRTDGELSERDHALILQRLCEADAQACGLPEAFNPQGAGSQPTAQRWALTASSDGAS
ncbi:MAG: hypothetical protein ER33_10270 [Cyanobium sp. CACIAM 14]|nr:MAG: hypothetical protein ER33_10270 [Cyanobium sp. CACIAM 14]